MAEKKRLSVAEMLAAARAEKGAAVPVAAQTPTIADGAEKLDAAESASLDAAAAVVKPAPPASSNASSAAAKSAGAAGKPAGAGGRPSIAEIMALARANNATATPVQPPLAADNKPKPAAAALKPTAAKAAVAKPAAAKPAAKLDSASILAAARAGLKPGPVSKSDAPPRPVQRQKNSAADAVASKAAPVARIAPPAPLRPIKPEAKKPATGVEDRRGFLELAVGSFMAIGFTTLSVTGGLFTLGLARFMFPNVLAEPPSRFKVGAKEGFPAGKVETKFVAQYGVWVVNNEFQGQQQIYALKTVCTHLGCTPNWLEAEQKFKCPCHGSGFYKDGVNFEGPAPRPLERYAVHLADDGQLEIDKSKTFLEELGQWADPESYIPA